MTLNPDYALELCYRFSIAYSGFNYAIVRATISQQPGKFQPITEGWEVKVQVMPAHIAGLEDLNQRGVFSLLISGHPVALKAVIMTFELVLNVWLFYAISRKWNNTFGVMLLSIVLSKMVYYLLKFGLISMAIFDSELISTPIYLQLITSVVFSVYLFFLFKRNEAAN